MADRASDRALLAIREEMNRKGLGQRDLATFLNCSQSKIAKLLNKRRSLGVDDLEDLCYAVGLPVTEAVRDRGLEFVAEMSPSELRLLEHIRNLPKTARMALMEFLRVDSSESRIEKRGITKASSGYGKPRPR